MYVQGVKREVGGPLIFSEFSRIFTLSTARGGGSSYPILGKWAAFFLCFFPAFFPESFRKQAGKTPETDGKKRNLLSFGVGNFQLIGQGNWVLLYLHDT